MKKSVNKIITLALITGVTLALGFGITAISFNLFGELSVNQMRILFAVDVLSLLAVCTFTHFFLEGKKAQAKRQRELEKRHSERVRSFNDDFSQIEKIIKTDAFVA